jgi:DNA helicase-2/ATP-dependent DNA helicase PcrA
MRFYQRQEIRDAIAYFRLLLNEEDDLAFERIMNTPRRGLGDKAGEQFKAWLSEHKLSYMQCISQGRGKEAGLKGNTLSMIETMVKVIHDIKFKLEDQGELYSEVLKQYLEEVGFLPYLRESDEVDRLENVQTLFADLDHYLHEHPESEFLDYLENIALTSSQDEIVDDQFVSLMTVHTAKGLEFEHVYLIGMNEGVFPSLRTITDDAFMGVEEERRLCYVAFTRAKKTLTLTCSSGFSFQLEANMIPSRFFKEANLAFPRLTPNQQGFHTTHLGVTQPSAHQPLQPPVKMDWQIGDHLHHDAFGHGVVKAVIDALIIEVHFETYGAKKLMGNHPKLKKVAA